MNYSAALILAIRRSTTSPLAATSRLISKQDLLLDYRIGLSLLDVQVPRTQIEPALSEMFCQTSALPRAGIAPFPQVMST